MVADEPFELADNIGVTPDQTVPDNQAVDAAATFLREQIAKGTKP